MSALDDLSILASPEFEAATVASTPNALRRVLLKRPEVRRLGRRYDAGDISDESLRQFVNRLLRRHGGTARFPYQTTLSAVAVMLEQRFSPFAQEYLADLARVRSERFLIASRVARISLGQRSRAATIQAKTFDLSRGEDEERPLVSKNWIASNDSPVSDSFTCYIQQVA